jgi:hypothetical protein
MSPRTQKPDVGCPYRRAATPGAFWIGILIGTAIAGVLLAIA